jgi:replicative DNA helicase
MKMRVYDQPRIDIEYIETVCHLQAMKHPLSVVVIDYLGLVTSCKKYDREDIKISDITQRLTALSIKLNCIVICLTQVNRDPSKRNQNDRCPYPADVADSVGSVRSSSLWIGIDRPELYQDELVNKNLFVAKCRKNRRGDNFEAYFDFNKGRFVERMKPQWKIDEPVSILDRLKKKGNYLGDY